MRTAAAPSTLVVTRENAALATMTSRVDPEGARRMMEMLVNLYADRRLAVVREYVSNAVDARRVAGSTEPVAITTPTMLEPNLVVADRGIGMSTEEVESTFLAFAASTKRHTDELIGGLGVGAKSAWAVAESFLVDTVKDGLRTLVRASRDLSHQVLLAGEPSDLPTGTTISVPIELGSNADTWRTLIAEVASAHDDGAVVVDGKPVPSLAAGPTRIGPVLCRKVPGRSDTVLIRSGGTLFSAVPEIANQIRNTTSLNACIVELPIGSFDHTPSRESIVATARTTTAVNLALAQFKREYAALEQRITALAATDIAAAVKLRAQIIGDVANYSVLPIPFTLQVPGDTGAWVFSSKRSRGRWIPTGGSDNDAFAATAWDDEASRTVLVTGVPAGRKLRAFATFLGDNHPCVRRVIPVPDGQSCVELEVTGKGNDPIGQTWTLDPASLPASNRYTFTEWIAATTSQRGTRGPAGGYRCVLVRQNGATAESVELSGKEIVALGLPVWFTYGDAPTYFTKDGASIASVGIYLGRRKEGPLRAAVPNVMTAGEWATQRFTALTAGWSHAELLGVVARVKHSSDLLSRFSIATDGRDRIAAEGRENVELLDQAATIHAAVGLASAERVAAIESVRGCTEVAAISTEIYTTDSQLCHGYPLLGLVNSYDARNRRDSFVDYVASVAPRSERKLSDA